MATIIGSTSSSNWTYKIDVYDISTNAEDISSVTRVDVYIGRANIRSYLGGRYSGHISINWETDEQVTETFSGTIPYPTYINAGGWYHIATKDFYVKHNVTGDKTIRVVSELTETEFNPNYASADGWVELTKIAVKTIAPDISGIIGNTYNISLSPQSSVFKHSIWIEFNTIKKWLQPDGSLGDNEFIFPTTNTNPLFTFPKMFYGQFLGSSYTGKYKVYTYNDNTLLGYDEGLLEARCDLELCSPKITADSTAYDINPITLALTHNNPNDIIRYASIVEVTPVITPSDIADINATVSNKFINDIPFEGDSVIINTPTDKTFWATATNSRGIPSLKTPISAKGRLIPYIPLSLNIVTLKRTEPTTGEVELEYNGNYFVGEFTDKTITSSALFVGNELLYDNIICNFPNDLMDQVIQNSGNIIPSGFNIVATTDVYNLFYDISEGIGDATVTIGLQNKETLEELILYYARYLGTESPIVDINEPNLVIDTSFGVITYIDYNDKVIYPYITKTTVQEPIVNDLTITWKYRAEGEEEYTEGGILTPDIDKNYNKYSGKVSLGDVFDYKKRYEFVFTCSDKINTEVKNGVVSRGFPVFWWTEDSFRVLGDLYVGDKRVWSSTEYSDDEQLIGVWRDGKPLYKKSLTGITPTQSHTWMNVAEVGTGFEVKHMYGSMKNYFPIPSAASFEYFVAFQYSGAYIQSYASGFLNEPFELTIEYTKKNDTMMSVEMSNDEEGV